VNHSRVAQLHREIARLHEELAAELGAAANDQTVAPTPAKSASVAKRASAPKKSRLVRPAGESDELAAAKARRFLRDNGLAQVNR